MNNNERWQKGPKGMKFLHGKPELSTGTGFFYTDAFAARVQRRAAGCGCLACRVRQRHQSHSNQESM
jgi:hypothetical protein